MVCRKIAGAVILWRMRMDELDYDLPSQLIARHPVHPRDQSRLLIYRRSDKSIEHRRFCELDQVLDPTDLLVANNTAVVPARLEFIKSSGGRVSGLFIEEIVRGRWRIMLKTRGRLVPGSHLEAINAQGEKTGLRAVAVTRSDASGQWILEWETAEDYLPRLARIGSPPLPPYIEKARQDDKEQRLDSHDAKDYQTTYARTPGALAAPTAGLHFTPELLTRLTGHGTGVCYLTLHVGLGTFLPVKAALLKDHPMHAEWFTIPAATVAAVQTARSRGRRIVAVGTTTVRALESAADAIQPPAGSGGQPGDIAMSTRLVISPGYNIRLTDALITNFHLPRSTLLALIAAFISVAEVKRVYREAVAMRYRFYSFGDAMLIL